MKLSIQKLKELLPDLEVHRSGKYGIASCPNCSKKEFTINLIEDGHKCGCNRKKKCGFVSNIFGLAKLLKRMDLLNLEGEVGRVEKLENKILQQTDIVYDLDLPTVKMPLGWQRAMQDDYMDSRGFTEYQRYQVGVTKIHPKLKNNYVIIAIEEEGEIKGYIGRHVWSKTKIDEENRRRKAQDLPQILRYSNSESDFGKLLFGYDDLVQNETKTVICTEGVFDMLNVSRLMNLYNQNEVKCVSTFKCAISIEQIIKLKIKGIETLILFYDPDVINQIKRTANYLQLWFNVLIAFNDTGDVDAGDIDAEGLSKVFSNLRTVSDFTSSKVVNKLV